MLSRHKSHYDHCHSVLPESPWRQARAKERRVCIILLLKLVEKCVYDSLPTLHTADTGNILQCPKPLSQTEKFGFLVTVILTILIQNILFILK